MNQFLLETVDKFKSHFYSDNRCLCMILHGSLGRGTDDEYSDVDLAIVVRDEDYNAVKSETRAICESICGNIQLWFPEGECDDNVNFAFLFEAEGEQFLYDFDVMTNSFYIKNAVHFSGKIIFDRTNNSLLKNISDLNSLNENNINSINKTSIFSPDGLLTTIQQYWLYTYLNGKYYRRSDIYKLIYIQQFLFSNHMELLHALFPEDDWEWWPLNMAKLSHKMQEGMLVYFNPACTETIAGAIEKELDMFSTDAQNACKKWDIRYPAELEKYVRRHLADMGLIRHHPTC